MISPDDIVLKVGGELLASVNAMKVPAPAPSNLGLDKWLVINCAVIPANIPRNSFFNINCHAKNLDNGKPDITTRNSLAKEVKSVLIQENITIDGETVLIDFDAEEAIWKAEMNSSYINLRYKLSIKN